MLSRVPLLLGIILLAFGISLAVVAWSPLFVAALQVFAVIVLLFSGLILSLVGYSAIKAEREFVESKESNSAETESERIGIG